jgi:hypothetical protein
MKIPRNTSEGTVSTTKRFSKELLLHEIHLSLTKVRKTCQTVEIIAFMDSYQTLKQNKKTA